MSQPPKRLKLGQVPAYILERHGIKVSKQSVYNWVKGVGVESLETFRIKSPNIRYPFILTTTAEKVDAFLNNHRIQRPR